VHDVLLRDQLQDAAASREVAALGERDETLGVRAKPSRLRFRRRDATVLEELCRQRGEHVLLVLRSAAETGPLGGRRHFFSSVLRRKAAGC